MLRLVMLVVLVAIAACSSPAERHMKRALCAGKGAVTPDHGTDRTRILRDESA